MGRANAVVPTSIESSLFSSCMMNEAPVGHVVHYTGDSSDNSNTEVVVSASLSPSAAVVKKRGVFPKPATNILRAWLFQNLPVSDLAILRVQALANISR